MKHGSVRSAAWNPSSVGGALDPELGERAQHPPPGGLAIRVVDDQLRDHRVVELGDLVSGPDPGVDPHARARRLLVRGDQPGGRQEPLADILGVDPALDRVPAEHDVFLAHRQGLALRDQDLLAHEIEAGDELGDRVLDLDPRVHLHEEVRRRPR